MVTGADLSVDLLRYLLDENARLLFGAFGVGEDGTIVLQHSVVGDSLDKVELESSVQAVLSLGDRYDDEIVDRFGGHRAFDSRRTA